MACGIGFTALGGTRQGFDGLPQNLGVAGVADTADAHERGDGFLHVLGAHDRPVLDDLDQLLLGILDAGLGIAVRNEDRRRTDAAAGPCLTSCLDGIDPATWTVPSCA